MAHSSSIYEKNVTARAQRVLIVEHEPGLRELFCRHLEQEGYDCEGAPDGPTAVRRAQAERFDLLVLDEVSPGVDGASLCRAVRNGPLNRDISILVLTSPQRGASGSEQGADVFLAKPFGVRELVTHARTLLQRPRDT